jgi:CheY-like chemotaxis protein
VVLDPAIGKVRADHNQLEQVVMNLAINARDAMPGGGTLTLSTSTSFLDASAVKTHSGPGGPYSVISVTDTGHGMDAETKAKIFEPFFTTKEQGKGTGLGLAMVYGIVQQSGGYITVQSEPGRGSVFSVHLPCVPDREEKTQAPEADLPHSGCGRILLVEDEQAVRELVRAMLTDAGYTVVVMNDVESALKLSRAELVCLDLVVTDVVMPHMSGPDLLTKLRERHPDLSVLYISGYTDHPLIRGGQLSDTAAFLQKPFTKAQLLLKVQKSLEGKLLTSG